MKQIVGPQVVGAFAKQVRISRYALPAWISSWERWYRSHAFGPLVCISRNEWLRILAPALGWGKSSTWSHIGNKRPVSRFFVAQSAACTI